MRGCCVNPRLIETGAETAVDDEGCLSLQGVLVPVERKVKVAIEAQDVARRVRSGSSSRGSTRASAQHELDHLDGT